jgi:hypothetical protein
VRIPLRLAVMAGTARASRLRAVSMLIETDVAGAFTDVLRAFAEAARGCLAHSRGRCRAIGKKACTWMTSGEDALNCNSRTNAGG